MRVADRFRAAWGAFVTPVDDGPRADAGSPPDLLNDPNGATVLNLLGGSSTRFGAISENEAIGLPAVLRALEVLCGVFAMTPCHYYRRLPDDGKARATDSPLYTLFHERPNNAQSIFAFKEALLGDLLLQGRFGSFIHRNKLIQPWALSRLDACGIQLYKHWSREDGYELFVDASLPDGSRARLTQHDCWYVSGFSRDGLCGIDRLKTVGEALWAARATSHFAARFWDNNGQPSTILTAKGKVDPQDKEKIRADWRKRFSGPRNAGGVAVLDQEMDAKFLAHDNKASQYIETRTFDVGEVARAFGVPPHLLFELSKATFSNIEHQSLEFITFCMMTHYERVASAATHAFAEPGHFFEFMPDALLKGDIKSRYEAYGIAIDKGMLNPDEARLKENMNRRPGGDKYRVGSGSTIEGEQQTASPPPPPNEP